MLKTLWHKIKKEWQALGPGFITGAADDDPSGIATYSIAGAQFGYKLSWLAWFLLPLMIGVQEASARIGLLTGKGLAGVLKKFYSRQLLIFAVLLVVIANTINIGADLGIMADSVRMVTGLPFNLLLIFIAVLTILLEIFIPYRIYAQFLRWFGFFLLVYVATAFLVTKDWATVIFSSLIPHLELSREFLMTAVGFLGTTISPYLFFWQAGEEVEEEVSKGIISDFDTTRPKLSGRELHNMRKDTDVGMFFSEFITFFIIATTAATLHANGITSITSPQQAALALKPLAGNFTYILFTLGIIGIGLQAVPVLAGSIAYAVSEALGASEGLSKTFNHAKIFYLTIAISTLVGMLINLLHINTIQALYYAAIINGVVAVPLIFIIMKLADNKKVVGENVSPKHIKFFGWLAFWFMLGAVVLMLGSWVGII